MSDTRPGSALIDLVAVIISPILVMMMVGSLVFFLIDVLHFGNYSSRLIYTYFFFIIGAVLIARISIQQGAARAGLYAAMLGAACFLAMLRFVEYPSATLQVLGPILNLFLMGFVWWCAHQLTWDCTHWDEQQKASGRGILAATGLEDFKSPDDEANADEPEIKPQRKAAGLVGWWERWQRYREAQKKKPHTPGTWILYFGLGALPLFALGQAVIPNGDAARRQFSFFMMVMYVGSALGLLLTTTLFGLRKYLEERNARVPVILTLSWLGFGAGLIVTLLVVGALLPRPHSETPLLTLQQSGKQDRSASKYAQVRDYAAGKGPGAKGQKTEAGDGKSQAKGGKSGGSQGEKKSGGGKGDQSGGRQSGGNKDGQKSSDPKQNDSSQQNQNLSDSGKDARQDHQQSDADQQGGQPDQEANEAREEADSSDGHDSGPSSSTSRLFESLDRFSEVIKWMVWAIIGLVIIVGIIWFILRGLAPFTNWARDLLNWLKSLFGPRAETEAEGEAQDARPEESLPPPFAVFSNPFADGTAARRTADELVDYTMQALEAWAWERDQGRRPDETPLEFVIRLGHHHPELDEPAFASAQLYMRMLYSRRQPRKSELQPLMQLWEALEMQPSPKLPRQATK